MYRVIKAIIFLLSIFDGLCYNTDSYWFYAQEEKGRCVPHDAI